MYSSSWLKSLFFLSGNLAKVSISASALPLIIRPQSSKTRYYTDCTARQPKRLELLIQSRDSQGPFPYEWMSDSQRRGAIGEKEKSSASQTLPPTGDSLWLHWIEGINKTNCRKEWNSVEWENVQIAHQSHVSVLSQTGLEVERWRKVIQRFIWTCSMQKEFCLGICLTL